MIFNLFVKSFLFVWEFPQNVLGLAIYYLNKNKIVKTTKVNGRYLFKNYNFGISLGNYIFWTPTINDSQTEIPVNMKHEFGHSIQSKYFGPLYLLIVGLPSISRVLYSKIYFSLRKKEWTKYYHGYPEKWADSLGLKHYKV